MSKIYEALRRAEREKGRRRSEKAAEALPRQENSMKRLEAIAGLDDRFRRSLLVLKNAIDSEMKAFDSRIVLFTSAVKGEGKTTIASGLARVLSLGEAQSILLIDCAVRNPQIHALFGARNDKGLVDYLAGRAKPSEIIQPIERGVLHLVSAGDCSDVDALQPLFSSERLKLFLKEVGSHYDYVIIDSSAILESPETPLVGSCSDGIVLVVHAARTKREVIKRAMNMVRKLEGRFIGTVLNRKKYYIPEFLYRRV